MKNNLITEISEFANLYEKLSSDNRNMVKRIIAGFNVQSEKRNITLSNNCSVSNYFNNDSKI